MNSRRCVRRLAVLADRRIQASRQEIAQSLEGHWREDLLFLLQQVHDLYFFHLESITGCDRQIEAHLKTLAAKVEGAAQPLPAAPRPPRRRARGRGRGR